MARSIIFVNNSGTIWTLDLLDGVEVPATSTYDATHYSDNDIMEAIQQGLGLDFMDDPGGRYLRINAVDYTAAQSTEYGNQADPFGTPGSAHASTHEGGSDPVTAAGIGAEPAFAKNSAFNKNFGAAGSDVCEGDDARLSDDRDPNAHAGTHANGGSDEVNVTGLSGLLADDQNPTTHATDHENGGADEISVAGLSGQLADAQTAIAHSTSHENGGGDEISVAGLSGLLADAQNPVAHRASHISGGSDALLSTDVIEAIVKRVQETGGPTTLDIGAIAAGQALIRVGTAIVGGAPTPAAHKDTHVDGGTDDFASTDFIDAIVRRIRESNGPTDLLVGAILDTYLLQRSGASVVGVDPATIVAGNPPQAHKNTHVFGGADALLSTDLIDAVVRRLRETGGPTDLVMAAVPDGDYLARSGGNVVGVTPPVFGQDYQVAVSLGRSTTTSATFQTKVTINVPAHTGTYLITWHAVVDQSSIADAVQSQLYNTTDTVVVGTTQEKEPKDVNDRLAVGGFAEIVFGGVAKSFEIQYRQQRGSTAGIQDARIMIWRVA